MWSDGNGHILSKQTEQKQLHDDEQATWAVFISVFIFIKCDKTQTI